MRRFVTIIFIISTIIIIYLAYNFYHNKQAEDELKVCIDEILKNNASDNITVETKGRGKFPLLSGNTSKYNKDKIIKNINRLCQVNEIQDFINDLNIIKDNNSYIDFSIDSFNNIITIKGAFNNQEEFDQALKSFNDVLPNMQIQHDVKIDNEIKSADIALDMALLLPSIKSIRVAEISIKNGKLNLNGIIRDPVIEEKTLQLLHQLFDDKYTIINELQQVIDNTEKYEIEIEPPSIPKFKLPKLDN